MSRRVNACAAVLGVAVLALMSSAGASASGPGSGGVGVSPPASATIATGLAASTQFVGGKIGVVSDGNVMVSATQNGMTISASASTLLGGTLTIKGQLPQGDAGQTVEIDRLGHQTGWGWEATAQATVRPDGTFSAVWATNHIGRFAIRAVIGSAAPVPSVMVTVYRPSTATWYGPTGSSNHTACGKRLTKKTYGVANRTLPCGERVAIYYGGRTVVVPVIDRGPYGDGADWDLTEQTARVLGMLAAGRATVGAVSLPRKP